jgi:hypothetical protein
MPLDKSGSKASVGANIKTEMAAGKPQKQAIAIAMNTKRKAQGFNKGGAVCTDPSAAQQFENNIAEVAANPTSKVGLAKGGPAKPRWRRW